MVVQPEDPITGTTWFDFGDLSGSAMLLVSAFLGLSILLFLFTMAREVGAPAIGDLMPVRTGAESRFSVNRVTG